MKYTLTPTKAEDRLVSVKNDGIEFIVKNTHVEMREGNNKDGNSNIEETSIYLAELFESLPETRESFNKLYKEKFFNYYKNDLGYVVENALDMVEKLEKIYG